METDKRLRKMRNCTKESTSHRGQEGKESSAVSACKASWGRVDQHLNQIHSKSARVSGLHIRRNKPGWQRRVGGAIGNTQRPGMLVVRSRDASGPARPDIFASVGIGDAPDISQTPGVGKVPPVCTRGARRSQSIAAPPVYIFLSCHAKVTQHRVFPSISRVLVITEYWSPSGSLGLEVGGLRQMEVSAARNASDMSDESSLCGEPHLSGKETPVRSAAKAAIGPSPRRFRGWNSRPSSGNAGRGFTWPRLTFPKPTPRRNQESELYPPSVPAPGRCPG